MKQLVLRPGDIVVALELAISPGSRLQDIAAGSLTSLGEVHNALKRLGAARLLKPHLREVVRDPLLGFLRWGVPHAFPAVVAAVTIGVETAMIGGPAEPEDGATRSGVLRDTEFVWPSSEGSCRGQALLPLYPNAPQLARANPRLCRLLSLVDAIRVGGAREAAQAASALADALTPAAPQA